MICRRYCASEPSSTTAAPGGAGAGAGLGSTLATTGGAAGAAGAGSTVGAAGTGGADGTDGTGGTVTLDSAFATGLGAGCGFAGVGFSRACGLTGSLWGGLTGCGCGS